MKEKITIEHAIRMGHLWINGPTILFLFAPSCLIISGVRWGLLPPSIEWVAFVLFFSSFVFGWLWWSFMIPKWRLWAYARVSNIAELKARAVQAQLI